MAALRWSWWTRRYFTSIMVHWAEAPRTQRGTSLEHIIFQRFLTHPLPLAREERPSLFNSEFFIIQKGKKKNRCNSKDNLFKFLVEVPVDTENSRDYHLTQSLDQYMPRDLYKANFVPSVSSPFGWVDHTMKMQNQFVHSLCAVISESSFPLQEYGRNFIGFGASSIGFYFIHFDFSFACLSWEIKMICVLDWIPSS